MRNRLVFAYESVREDDDLIEDVKDFLDASAEGEWEVMSWATNQGIVVVVSAPLECRTMHLEPALEMEFIPLSAALDEMSDRNNEWIEPEPTDEQSSLGLAQEMSQRWMSSMFDEDNVVEATSTTPAAPVEEKPKRRSSRKARRDGSQDAPAKKVRSTGGDAPAGRNPDKRGGQRRAPEDTAPPKVKETPQEEPAEPERQAAPPEQRAGASDLMAKFGLKGTLKGSDAMGEMFVFKDDEGDQND